MKGLKNNVKSSIKSFICGTLIGILSIGPAASANAQSSVNSASFTVSHAGYSYRVYNSIITGSDSNGKYATAATIIGSVGGVSVPAGYMGSKPKLYDADGYVVDYGEWRYNSSNTISMYNPKTLRGFSGSPAVYSQGQIKVWMGTDYYTYGTYKTPNLNDYT